MIHNKHQTLLVIVIGLMAVGYLFEIPTIMSKIAFGIGLFSLLIPILGDWVILIWEKLAFFLGWFNSRVLLTIIFYLFLFPIALLARLKRSDVLNLNPKGKDTLFTSRNYLFKAKDLENPW